MNKILKSLFEIIVAIQFIAFVVFVVGNINTLEEVTYTFTFLETEYEFSISFYSILEIIAIIFLVAILASFSFVGIGISSEGTKTIMKYISFILLFIVLGLGTTYYLTPYPELLLIFQLFSAIIYFFYLIWSNMEKGVD